MYKDEWLVCPSAGVVNTKFARSQDIDLTVSYEG